MFGMLYLLGTFFANLFKPQRRLEIENLFLRHQLNIAATSARTVYGFVGVTGRYWSG
jgi:hypothetical protein